jgi:hypothetical protein
VALRALRRSAAAMLCRRGRAGCRWRGYAGWPWPGVRCRCGPGRRPRRRWRRGGGAAPRCPSDLGIQSARRAGLAWAAVRLVTAYTVTVRQCRLASDRTRRVMRIAWVAWGKSRLATVVTCRRRGSTRPWPRSRVWSGTGTSHQGRALNVGGQPVRLERTPRGHGPRAALPASGSCPGSSGPAGPSPTRSCVRAASFPLGRRRSPAGVAPAAARRSGPTRSTPARSPSAARLPAARRHRHPLRAAALRQTGSDRGTPVPRSRASTHGRRRPHPGMDEALQAVDSW